jgi:hypothetical protein
MATTVTTLIPDGVDWKALVETLHNHDLMVRTLCPQLISYEHEDGIIGIDSPVTYSVTDQKPLGEATYQLILNNVEYGVDSLVVAKIPLGTLVISSNWRVGEDDDEQLVLSEVVEIEANMVMKKIVQANVDKTHPSVHIALMSEALRTD